MKKQLIFLLMTFLTLFMSTEVYGQDYVGTWKCISSIDVQEGKSFTDYMKGQYLVVKADGTYSSTSDDIGSGSYTMQGDVFTAKNNHGVTITAVLSMSDGRLMMEGTTSGGVTFLYAFEKAEEMDFVGTWKCISSIDIQEGKSFTDYMKGQYLVVKADGTYSSTSDDIGSGSYTMQGDVFTAKNNHGVTITAVLSMSDGRLMMEGMTSGGVTFSYVFEKADNDKPEEPDEPDETTLMKNGLLYSVKSDGTLEVKGLDKEMTTADIPSTVNINGTNYFVTSIGERAFDGRSDITYLSIPYSIKSIGEYAFINCGSNMTVNIEDLASWCLMELGNEHASPLSSARTVMSNNVVLDRVEIPEGVPYIGNFTFYQCRGITSLIIPSSVKMIGSSAFEDCTGLTSVTLNEGLVTIGGSSFEGCSGLTTLTIPSTVVTIAINAFKNCMGLNEVNCYAESVPDTHEDAFDMTPTGSSTLYVPAGSVEAYKNSWPWSDFKEIVPLTEDDQNPDRKRTIHVAQAGTLSDYINIDDRYLIEDLTLTGEINGVDFRLLRNMAGKSYEFVIRDNRFYGSDTGGKLSVLDLSGVKIVAGGDYMHWDYNIDYEYDLSLEHDDEIPPYVFCGCIGLTSIIFPNSVTIIGDNTFYECTGLRMIKLGSGVKEIGYGAFANILKLNETTRSDDDYLHIYCEAEEVPTISSDAFTGTDMSRVVLHVPDNLINEYKAADVWKEIGTIEGLSETGIKAISNEMSEAQIYDVQGNRLNNVRKGLNIIRMSDGKVKKVIVK